MPTKPIIEAFRCKAIRGQSLAVNALSVVDWVRLKPMLITSSAQFFCGGMGNSRGYVTRLPTESSEKAQRAAQASQNESFRNAIAAAQ
jgi:hypothetical protein